MTWIFSMGEHLFEGVCLLYLKFFIYYQECILLLFISSFVLVGLIVCILMKASDCTECPGNLFLISGTTGLQSMCECSGLIGYLPLSSCVIMPVTKFLATSSLVLHTASKLNLWQKVALWWQLKKKKKIIIMKPKCWVLWINITGNEFKRDRKLFKFSFSFVWTVKLQSYSVCNLQGAAHQEAFLHIITDSSNNCRWCTWLSWWWIVSRATQEVHLGENLKKEVGSKDWGDTIRFIPPHPSFKAQNYRFLQWLKG